MNIYTSNLTAGRLQNQKLTPDIRALIFGAAVDGQNYRGISARFNVSISTVSGKIKKFSQRTNFETKVWSSYFRALTDTQKRSTIQTIKKTLKSHNFRPKKKSRHCRFHINDYSIFKKSKPAEKNV